MGCCLSSERDDDASARRFHVKNLDDENRVVGEGELEVTDTHLILYSKNQPIKWPLKYLRRYGYDDNLFSFEAGRRCPTGEGIYAFSTRSAEAIFRLVETNIRTGKSKRLNDEESDGQLPTSGPAAPRVSPPPQEADSPTPAAPEPKLVTEGNAKHGGTRFSYAELDLPPANKAWRISQNPVTNKKRSGYATIDFPAMEAAKGPANPPLNYAQMYFTGKAGEAPKPPPQAERTNYAEVIPSLRQSHPSNGAPTDSLHYADVSVARPDAMKQARQEEVQLAYVQLDLSHSTSSSGVSGAGAGGSKKPPSTSEVQYAYTQIDFTKTHALSQVASGAGEYANTSSRQTRHT